MPYRSLIAALRNVHCAGPDYDILDIPTDPDKTILYVAFNYDCSFAAKAFVRLWADNALSDIQYFNECPCRWLLNRKVESLTLISSASLQPECIRTEVIYEDPEVWAALVVKESYPLPSEPAEISRVTFEAKTDADTTSVIELFAEGSSLARNEVTPTPETIEWGLGSAMAVSLLAMTNTGSSTVYIRNLITEL